MILIFEDNYNSPSSRLLTKSDIKSKIYFSNGNLKLKNKIKEVSLITNELIVAFLDVVPDNKMMCDLYGWLIDYYEEYDNIIILPILCTEYYILSYIQELNSLGSVTDYFTKLQNNYNWREWYDNKFGNCTTLEKFCKLLCNNINKSCMRNHINNKYTRLFYTKDCNCDTYCKLKGLTIDEKANALLEKLPIFSDMVVFSGDITMLDVVNRIKLNYDKIFSDYNMNNMLNIEDVIIN